MTLEEYYKKIDIHEINRLIEDSQEENLTLEFKNVVFPNKSDKDFDFKNLSKALSGFANSSGGIIIWGIKAEKKTIDDITVDVADEKKPIKNPKAFLNKLNTDEGRSVLPRISGIKHEIIYEDKSSETGFIKTLVPESDSLPHMALFDKHYYKRNGDSFYQCEHYDLIDLFNRKQAPNFEIIFTPVGRAYTQFQQTIFPYLISIKNTGKGLAKMVQLHIDVSDCHLINGAFDEYGLDGNRNTGIPRILTSGNVKCNYSGGYNIAIFPNQTFEVDKLKFIQMGIPNKGARIKIKYAIAAEGSFLNEGEFIIDGDELQKLF